ncbi:MAG: 4Fe-4S binding protein [Candidatus Lokiarchaeota archaeon]|nr:4Fe-4S binding protein [Candidatus Lokiarchaeota archaeon]
MNIKSFYKKLRNQPITILRRVAQVIAFLLVNYIIIETIFAINLLSLDSFIKVLPILNSAKNPLSNGAGMLEYIFFFITEGVIPLFLIAVLIMVLLFTNRIFCGWICPIGAFQDACAAIPTKKKSIKPSRHNSLLKIKYVFVILIVILIIPLGVTILSNNDFYLDYKANLGDLGENPMGYFSLSEFIFVFFPSLLGDMFSTGSIQPLFSNFIVFFIFFFYIALIILSVWYPRVYCRYICPFGAVASAVGEYSFLKLSRNPVKCVGRTECGICERVCPKQVRMLDEPFEFFTGKGECNFCLKCKELCPYDAINIKFG